MADGLSLITLTCHLGDKFDCSQLPGMKKLSFFERLYVLSVVPFSLIKLGLKFLFMVRDLNPIHPNKPLTGLKRSSITRDLKVDELKLKSKELNVTINDLLMTLTSISIKQYLMSKGDKKTSMVKMAVPISLREPPDTVHDYNLYNDFAIVHIELHLY
eukprot:CAMPEP_0170566164 /NCGR_PEP_ID=MMETSP0211-20121228/79662_1 /TAXON_ID=311385 /ORGANISM="Pseudokeronopsis sp., Strain OXSARD2" /LENGTH=157 /DNA_ID=CAMNT_0010887261 /DNA_START=537 /DNA_END=1010 /DNA_ORIENTATION=-